MILYLDSSTSVGARNASDSASVKGAAEGHDRKFFALANVFIRGVAYVFVDVIETSFSVHESLEHGLECVFIRTGATHHCGHAVHTSWCHSKQRAL